MQNVSGIRYDSQKDSEGGYPCLERGREMSRKRDDKKKEKSKETETSAQVSNGIKLSRKEFDQKLVKLQVELCRIQEWVKQKGLRVIVIFEGRDAAGKRITERVSPRVFRVVALPAPTEREGVASSIISSLYLG